MTIRVPENLKAFIERCERVINASNTKNSALVDVYLADVIVLKAALEIWQEGVTK